MAVHDAPEVGEIGRRARVQRVAELGRRGGEFRDDIGNRFRDVFQARGLDAIWPIYRPVVSAPEYPKMADVDL